MAKYKLTSYIICNKMLHYVIEQKHDQLQPSSVNISLE